MLTASIIELLLCVAGGCGCIGVIQWKLQRTSEVSVAILTLLMREVRFTELKSRAGQKTF